MLSGKIVPTLKKRKIPSHAGLGSYQLLSLVLLSENKNSQPVEPWSTMLLFFIDTSFMGHHCQLLEKRFLTISGVNKFLQDLAV